MPDPVFLAVDLGAESGRVMAAVLRGGAQGGLALEEVHRFANRPRERDGHLRWDLDDLWAGIRSGLARSAERYGDAVRSVAFDTWGVDYGLLDADGALMADPIHYRDARNDGARERAYALLGAGDQELGAQQLYKRSGVAPLVFNTDFQLLTEDPRTLERADRLLMMSDLLAWKLSGVAANEWTNASTTQLLRPGGKGWNVELMADLGIPRHLFPDEPTRSASVLGPIRAELAAELGWTGDAVPQVVTSAGHDTAAAVAAAPVPGGAYVSCGTWSLMGVLTPDPVLSEEARQGSLSNELGWDGNTRLLKNIMGLWLVQQCRATFAARGREYDYATLTRLAAEAPDPVAVLDAEDERFFPPGSPDDPYADRVIAWYRERGLAAPDGDGAIVRAVLRGLARSYATCAQALGETIGHAPERLLVVGGGVRNTLLREFTSEAMGVPVEAGTPEATALGNALVQAVAVGELSPGDVEAVSRR